MRVWRVLSPAFLGQRRAHESNTSPCRNVTVWQRYTRAAGVGRSILLPSYHKTRDDIFERPLPPPVVRVWARKVRDGVVRRRWDVDDVKKAYLEKWRIFSGVQPITPRIAGHGSSA